MYHENLTPVEETQSGNALKVLHVASEAVPFAKVGGLADVVGSLPLALSELGPDIRLIMPAYRNIKSSEFKLKQVSDPFIIELGDKTVEASLLMTDDYNFKVYFVDCPEYFDREGIYGYETPDGFEDNLERYTILCKSVLEAFPNDGWMPDLIHCHDWQSALLPAYLAYLRNTPSPFSRVSSLYTIHNLAYQGNFPKEKRTVLGLQGKPFSWRKLKYFGKINLMKIAIVGADWVNTVSPGYRDETLQGGPTGAGMEVFLRTRKRQYSGIINGIDYDNWNPANDRHIPFLYEGDIRDFKAGNKAALLKEIGLESSPPDLRASALNKPLIGMVTRIVHQKGVDIVLDTIEDIVSLGYNLVVLGAGDRNYSDRFKFAARRFSNNVFYDFRYNEPMAHRIYAASDMFLMPSRFEPCGLSQMIAMHYGTLPIVHDVGGVKDTVEDFEPVSRVGTGFKFSGLFPQKIIAALQRALWTYKDIDAWDQLRKNAMKVDFSWKRSAEAYYSLYKNIVNTVRN